jgi:hypothetical protein
MTPAWHFALGLALIGFAVGFITGYGIRAFISYRRRKAARQRDIVPVPRATSAALHAESPVYHLRPRPSGAGGGGGLHRPRPGSSGVP